MQHDDDDDDDDDDDADADDDGDGDDDDDYYYYYDYDYVCCGSCSSPENGGAEPTVLKINFEWARLGWPCCPNLICFWQGLVSMVRKG